MEEKREKAYEWRRGAGWGNDTPRRHGCVFLSFGIVYRPCAAAGECCRRCDLILYYTVLVTTLFNWRALLDEFLYYHSNITARPDGAAAAAAP